MGATDESDGVTRPSVTGVDAITALAVACFVVATFTMIVVGGRRVVDATDTSPASIALAAAVVAVAYDPVFRGARRFASRCLGAEIPTAKAVERFGATMARHREPEAALDEMADVLVTALPATSVVVWLRIEQELVPVAVRPITASEPDPVDASPPDAMERVRGAHGGHVLAIRHADVLLGALSISTSRPLQASELELLHGLTSAAAIVSRTASLRRGLRRWIELAAAQEDRLRVARARTDAAQLTERRRLERDLHDTCQQRAVVLAAKLGYLADGAATDPGEVEALLDDLDDDIRRVADSIDRALTADQRAAGLDDGLATALYAQTADATPPIMLVDATEGRYPDDIECEVYACCLEAIQNAVKHAEAAQITVRLEERDAQLRFEVVDDGTGFDPDLMAGSGLVNLRARLDGLGGQLQITSGCDGTVVAGRVPIPTTEGPR